MTSRQRGDADGLNVSDDWWNSSARYYVVFQILRPL